MQPNGGETHVENKLVRRFIYLSCLFAFWTIALYPAGGLAANFVDLDGNELPHGKISTLHPDSTLVVQTSEVTIMLEKKMPAPQTTGEAPPAADKESVSPPGSETGGPSGDTKAGETVVAQSPFKDYTHESKSFKDLEDPFAEKEKPLPPLRDPVEGYNRFMYNVNEKLYDYFFEPVARGYRNVVHEEIRLALKNMFDNALSPVKFVSSAIQGDMHKSGVVLSRFVLNSTIGIAGLFDVAGNEYELENVNEDFDQALGYHGVPNGPYIVLPFFGPSTARHTVGRVVDSFLNPTTFFSPSFLVGAGITVEEKVNDTSFIIEDKKSIEESAVDEYESVRDFYHQYREGLINK